VVVWGDKKEVSHLSASLKRTMPNTFRFLLRLEVEALMHIAKWTIMS
jgi:hypothetical protein